MLAAAKPVPSCLGSGTQGRGSPSLPARVHLEGLSPPIPPGPAPRGGDTGHRPFPLRGRGNHSSASSGPARAAATTTHRHRRPHHQPPNITLSGGHRQPTCARALVNPSCPSHGSPPTSTESMRAGGLRPLPANSTPFPYVTLPHKPIRRWIRGRASKKQPMGGRWRLEGSGAHPSVGRSGVPARIYGSFFLLFVTLWEVV